jgi:nucleoporin NUP145
VTSIWKLASVIFDARDLPGEVQNVKDSGVINRVLDIKHREGLLGWLTNEIQDEIDSQFSKSSDSFEKIFLSLVLNNISDASKFAFKSQNAHLSVLITLLGSNDPEVRYSATKQIEYWQNNSILQTIPINLLKIYYLLKGDPIHSDYYIDVLENLSWKARLSLLLSYGDINQSLSTLLTTFIESKASSDIPDIDRTQFLLLKLFVSKQSDKYDLKEIFTSLNNGGKLDVSLQWYIFEILIRSTKQLTFGAGDSNSVVGDELTSLYAEQLISSELYQEGIFVLSHLHDDEQVNSLISKLIAVNIEKFSKIDGLLHNLTTLLKVPTRLIIESKALYYSSTGNIWKEVSYFLDAENFEEAHKTIINKVAPAAVINNGPKLKFLEELIARFPEQHSIKDWNIGLLVYKNYIRSIRFNNESSLRYLVDNLPHVKQSNFKIKVAVRLMSKKVATRLVELSRSEGQSLLELDKQKILKLPLGEDAPSFAKDFAVEYFKQILTGVYN